MNGRRALGLAMAGAVIGYVGKRIYQSMTGPEPQLVTGTVDPHPELFGAGFSEFSEKPGPDQETEKTPRINYLNVGRP